MNEVREHTLGDILRTATPQGECRQCGAKIYGSPDSQCPKCGTVNNPTHIVETQPDTPTVDRLLARFNKQWEETAVECLLRAQELEEAASDLRDRARLLRQAMDLTVEVKGAVLFEINARNRAASLVLVHNGG